MSTRFQEIVQGFRFIKAFFGIARATVSFIRRIGSAVWHISSRALLFVLWPFRPSRYLSFLDSKEIPAIPFFLLSTFLLERYSAYVLDTDFYYPPPSFLTVLCPLFIGYLREYELQLARMLPFLHTYAWVLVAWAILWANNRVRGRAIATVHRAASQMVYALSGPVAWLTVPFPLILRQIFNPDRIFDLDLKWYQVGLYSEYREVPLVIFWVGTFFFFLVITTAYARHVFQVTFFRACLIMVIAHALTATPWAYLQLRTLNAQLDPSSYHITVGLYSFGERFEPRPYLFGTEPEYRMWEEEGYVIRVETWGNNYAIYATPLDIAGNYSFVYFKGAVRLALGREATIFDPIFPKRQPLLPIVR